MLRINSGLYAHKKLILPPSHITRPVGEKARGAIFNMLGASTDGASVLDLYAGSGALGLEALSRGAKHVDFVEKNRKVASVLKNNVSSLGVWGDARVVIRPVERFLIESPEVYEVILMDPPYVDFSLAIVEQAASLLQSGGTLVVSTSSKTDFSSATGLELVRQKVYGDSMITVLTKNKS